MRTKCVLLALSLLALCITQAGAALVNFTGNVDVDFAIPQAISMPDTQGDTKGPAGGCDDEPLGQNAFREPKPGNELIPPSGFNLERVVTAYDCTTDTLFIGLDVCDGKIAWDADGNGDKTTINPNIVPGFTLHENFTDAGLEEYLVRLDMDPNSAIDLDVSVVSANGGITVSASTNPAIPGVTVSAVITGPDVEVSVQGLRKAFPFTGVCQPIRITTRSGLTGDLVNEDVTNALFDLCCQTCLQITKKVSCSPDGPWTTDTISVPRGTPVYFQICVTNPGTCDTQNPATGNDLRDVTIKDKLTLEVDNAITGCTGCTSPMNCIPTSTGVEISSNIGDLLVGQTKCFVCGVTTNAAFSISGSSPDATNTASATGIGKLTGTTVSTPEVSASVNLLVPSITCTKLADNDTNFDPNEPNDPTPASNNLNLSVLPFGVKTVYYKICVNNTGETPIDFNAVQGQACPGFSDDFIKPGGTTITLQGSCGSGPYLIPGTNQDLNAKFRAKLAGGILPAGQSVCLTLGVDAGTSAVTFDESKLCCTQGSFTDHFTACGRSTGTCMPAAPDTVTTNCQATVIICPPRICLEKKVACSPDGPWLDSVKVVRGVPVYFRIVITNCGGEELDNIVLTDTITEQDNALLDCTGCTGGLPGSGCIPGVFNIPGTLGINQSKTYICTIPTNGAFAIVGLTEDGRNTASVTAQGVNSDIAVSDGPEFATVDLLIPGIACSKGVASNAQLSDLTQNLNLSPDGTLDQEHVWYQFCVTNTGEIDVSFAPDGSPPCPGFSDNFIKVGGTSSDTCRDGTIVIPGTNFDLNAAFLAQLTNNILSPGQKVCVVREVTFDERKLCCVKNIWPDTFSACGVMTGTNICLPPTNERGLNTGNCNAEVRICPKPCIDITKEVSCSPDGPWLESVQAVRGVPIYFRIKVKNCGGRNLTNVTIKDTLTKEEDNALLACTGCTNGLNCLPTTQGQMVSTNIGNLLVGEEKIFICTVTTNPNFPTEGQVEDIVNSAEVTATVVSPAPGDDATVSDGPDDAKVDLLIPGIACSKLIDDDNNFAADGADNTPPTCNLVLPVEPLTDRSVWYQLCVENTGETQVDFTPGAGACLGFTDAFLETLDPQFLGTGVNLDPLFLAQLTNNILPPGQKVCVIIGPVHFNQPVICPRGPVPDTFSACGLMTGAGVCLPPADQRGLSTGNCTCQVVPCPPRLCIEKKVSCLPDRDFAESVTALRGAPIYFRIVVTNCGGFDLTNVKLTDTLIQEVDNALTSCSGCTNGFNCIPTTVNNPVVTIIPSLPVGQSKTFVCTMQTNGSFSVIGSDPDATNRVCGQADVVNPPPGVPTKVDSIPPCDEATVNLLVPGIECQLLMDDDSDFSEDPGDPTPPAVNLNLSTNGAPQIEHVWKKLTVCNTGEVDVSFVAGADPNCPDFHDKLLEDDFGIDVAQAFRDALVAAFGSQVLPAGQCVSKVFGPLDFDETVLCPNTPIKINEFTACGFATDADICLPPGGGEKVDTGWCRGTIMFCQPGLFQAYPGDSNGTNVHYMGHLGKSGETISAVPGLLVLVPGDNWENFVAAAQAGIAYSLKNVTLIKETPEFIQCTDVFPPIIVQQQGTSNIRLRWPLMYEAPGTTFTLTIQYGTSVLWDDDGVLGPHIPSYYHENVWEWKINASLESMKLLLELFHEVAFGTDEVPLISDEVLYPILQAKLDNIIELVADENFLDAGLALGEFEMEVADACIPSSPRAPYPTGPGTGIASTEENPACCKILVDAEFVGIKLGIFQGLPN